MILYHLNRLHILCIANNNSLANTVDINNPNITIMAKNTKHDIDNIIIPNTIISLFAK